MVKPPYGILSAVSVDRGEICGRAHGDTPDNIRITRSLPERTFEDGTARDAGCRLMVTKTIVVMGDPQTPQVPGRQRGSMLRAYDKNNGQEVGPSGSGAETGSPMTYSADGQEVTSSSPSAAARYSGEYISLRLQGGATRTSSPGQ